MPTGFNCNIIDDCLNTGKSRLNLRKLTWQPQIPTVYQFPLPSRYVTPGVNRLKLKRRQKRNVEWKWEISILNPWPRTIPNLNSAWRYIPLTDLNEKDETLLINRRFDRNGEDLASVCRFRRCRPVMINVSKEMEKYFIHEKTLFYNARKTRENWEMQAVVSMAYSRDRCSKGKWICLPAQSVGSYREIAMVNEKQSLSTWPIGNSRFVAD